MGDFTATAEHNGLDHKSQALTTEWLVSFIRWVILLIFVGIEIFLPAKHQTQPQLLTFFIFLGVLYNLYLIYMLHRGIFTRHLTHFLSFSLFCDLLLLVALAYFSNLFEYGLLTFFVFLIIIVTLRANMNISVIAGSVAGLTYVFTSIMLAAGDSPGWHRMALDVAGLLGTAAACGWFSEGKTKAWRMLHEASQNFQDKRVDPKKAGTHLPRYRKLDELSTNFTSIMSHELRTPLTAVIGFADVLLMGEVGQLNSPQQDCVNEMLQKSLELCRLIDNLLDISKIQSGRMSLNLKQVAPGELSRKAISSLAPLARKKNITIEHSTTGGEMPDLSADRKMIEHVLVNILGNAVKFSPTGSRVTLGEEVTSDRSLEQNFPHLVSNAQVVQFSVTDQGPGVPQESRQEIFKQFSEHLKGEKKVQKEGEGAGVGLYLAKEIVDLHWGKIWCEETPGGGCTFHVTLPVNPLRFHRKIAISRVDLHLGDLLEGILLQYQDEILRKNLSIVFRQFPDDDPSKIRTSADRQLLQGVLFNIVGNQIRHAFEGSELLLSLTLREKEGCLVIRIENRGTLMPPEKKEETSRAVSGEVAGDQDLRHLNVSLDLARDIIESHGGTFTYGNVDGEGVAHTITLPLPGIAENKGGSQ